MGADISVISEKSFFLNLKYKPELRKVYANFKSPGGKPYCRGQFTMTTTVKDKPFRIMLFVVTGPAVNNLLGREASVAMTLVKKLEEVMLSC